MNVRPRPTFVLALAVAALAAPAAASALTCYMVLDRSDNVVYRDTYPPIDLSDQGNAERDAMRRRGEHLIAMEADRCPTLEFFLGNAGSANLNVDQVVGGMPARSLGGIQASGATPAAAAPSQRPARAAPAPRRGY